MEQDEPPERPWQRQQQVDQGEWIEDHCVPLGEVRKAAVVERVPKRDLAMPEIFAMKVGQRVTKQGVIAKEECLCTENNVGKSRADQDEQNKRKAAGRKPRAVVH